MVKSYKGVKLEKRCEVVTVGRRAGARRRKSKSPNLIATTNEWLPLLPMSSFSIAWRLKDKPQHSLSAFKRREYPFTPPYLMITPVASQAVRGGRAPRGRVPWPWLVNSFGHARQN